MNKEYRERIEAFSSVMLQAKTMMKAGIINEKDYIKIENKMAEKYCIKVNSLYRTIDLIKES